MHLPDEDWSSYRRLVLDHMERTEASLTRIEGRLTALRVKVAGVAATAGLLAGSVVSLIVKALG